MRKILQSHSTLLNNQLSNVDNFFSKVGKQINVYKFRKVSGIIRITNEGEKTLKKSNNSFQQTTNVYTGKEPITVVWSGSTKAFLDENKIDIIKEIKVGEYHKLYSNGANINSLVIDNIEILNKNYVNTYITKNISLTSFDWIPNDDDILEYVYLILDNVNQSQQWLEIQDIIPYFNEETGNFQYCEINFETINLKYSKTGKTILDFIQFGGIGEGYAFPKETKLSTGETIVEVDYIKKIRENDGVNQLQFDFNSGTGNSSFFLWGRKKEKVLDDGTIKIEASHILLPYKCNFPKVNPFFYNRPNLNSYVGINWLPTKQEIWKSYKEAYKGNERIGEYNIDKQKEVLVGFKHDLDQIRNSNKNMSSCINWDNFKNFFFKTNVDLKPIPYVKKIDYINRHVNYAEFFTINAFLNFYTDVISYDYRETTKYKISDVVGILGGLFNILVGGLDIGFTSTSVLAPTQPINFLLPCISFEDGKAALSDDAPLPSDIFIDENVKKVLPTATNVLTSWNFSLTDRFIDKTLVLEGKPLGKGGNGVWDTKYLGQKTDEDGNLLFDDGSPLLLNLQEFSPTYPSTTQNDFIIDLIDFKALSQCEYRLSAYNIQDENIYSCYLETNAKARNEITIWGNQLKFNYYDEFNTIGQVEWPKTVFLPRPDKNKLYFNIPNLNNLQIFTINGKFDELKIDSGWNGIITKRQQKLGGGCSLQWGCTEYGEYYRVFKADNGEYLYKNNISINREFDGDISEINIDFFETIRIIFYDDNYIDISTREIGVTKEYILKERLFFEEDYVAKYNGPYNWKGGISRNTTKDYNSGVISGKDKHLLIASTDESEKINITIILKDKNTLTLKTNIVYKKVYISLDDKIKDLKYDYKDFRTEEYYQLQNTGSFYNLFSSYTIKNVLLIPK